MPNPEIGLHKRHRQKMQLSDYRDNMRFATKPRFLERLIISELLNINNWSKQYQPDYQRVSQCSTPFGW